MNRILVAKWQRQHLGAEESPAGSEDNESSNGSEDIKRWEWRWWVDAIAKMAAVSVLAGGILLVILPIGAHGDHFTEDPDQPHVVTNAVTEYSGASPARPEDHANDRAKSFGNDNKIGG